MQRRLQLKRARPCQRAARALGAAIGATLLPLLSTTPAQAAGSIFVGGGYPAGVSRGKADNRFAGEVDGWLGGAWILARRDGVVPRLEVGGDLGYLTADNVVGDSRITGSFFFSRVRFSYFLPMSARTGFELKTHLGGHGMLLEGMRSREGGANIGVGVGFWLPLHTTGENLRTASGFFLRPSVEYSVFTTENIGEAHFVIPGVTLSATF